MSDREKFTPTTQDFSTAFTGLLHLARLCGVDTCQEPVRKFIEMSALTAAHRDAEIRYLYNIVNQRLVK